VLVNILLQAQKSGNASFEAGAQLGQACGMLILLGMLVASIVVIVKWPPTSGGRFAVGFFLLTLPFSGWVLAGIAYLTQSPTPFEAVLFVPASWLIWIVLIIYGNVIIRRFAKHAAERDARSRTPVGVPFNQPYSVGPAMATGPAPATQEQAPQPHRAPAVDPATPVVARCTACMGRWKTTAGEAKALDTCPKCGVSPPDLRLQRIK
jgi:hypothetical protein